MDVHIKHLKNLAGSGASISAAQLNTTQRTKVEQLRGNKEFLSTYKNDIESIKKEYEGVKITYEMGEPEAKEVDGMLIIVQNDKQHIDISDETLNNIISAIENVRNKIINL